MLSVRSQYLNELGVPGFLHISQNKHSQQSAVQPIKTKCLVLETKVPKGICSAGTAQDFLYKMMGAIGLDKHEITCIQVDSNDLDKMNAKYQAQTILLTNDELSMQGNNVFSIDHPNDILKNEQLKREAWEVLKKMKACLK